MRRVILIMACLAGLSSLAYAAPVSSEQVRYVMGTPATVTAWAPESTLAEAAVEVAFFVFDRVDSLMSTWRDDSVLSLLNRAEPGAWVEVGPEVCEVLMEAKALAEASGGAFDPTILPLVRLWGFRDGKAEVPSEVDLAAVVKKVGHQWLEVDQPNGRARLTRPDMAVDLGGIAKGYALDKAAAAMRRAGAVGGVVDLGGNILAFGKGPAARVGIVDPLDQDLLAATVPLSEAAAATSGQYERFLTIEGRKYGHILDPRNGRPVPGNLSVTVLAAEAMLADALATAAVVLGWEDGLALIDSIPGAEAVFAIPDSSGAYRLETTAGLLPPDTNR